jgi:enamine deaminase RidA (YjgF/YER057c/UK114 family)
MRRLISSGSKFETDMAYSRAVVDGDWIFVSGCSGYDYATMTIRPEPLEQAAQALRNIEAALQQAAATLADVVRVHYYLTDAADFEPCWPALRAAFGKARPAATMLCVSALADPHMKIEIEVTALRASR